ncbi:MAG TPA: sulfite oxidase [Anaerolineales bacterium]|nr:sulfite oxidase [Anaerolineales bacterium]
MSGLETLIPVTEEPLNAETPLAALRFDITPSELVYVRSHFAIPTIDAEIWRLKVSGAVESPGIWSLRELQALPAVEQIIVLECAGNGRSGMDPVPAGTPWGLGAVSFIHCTGTPLVNVLHRAGISPEAVEVLFFGADHGEVTPGRQDAYARSLPIREAISPDILLVWAVNGHPLSPEHGYPLRLIVPTWYGMASVKWLEEIRAVTEPFRGYFQSEHYTFQGDADVPDGHPVDKIRIRSVITSPGDGGVIPQGDVEILGAAWSSDHSISEVLVSTDLGVSWDNAVLQPPPSIFGAWQWRFQWLSPEPGGYTILARAFDSDGGSQPLTHRWNLLGYGNNGVRGIKVRVLSSSSRPVAP